MDEMSDDVQAYIDGIDPAHRPLFDRLAALARAVAPDADLVISYGIPTFKVGKQRLHLGTWKHGISIYGWSDADAADLLARHPKLRTGKGTIQLRSDAADAVTDDELRPLFAAVLGGGVS
jgi:uncharacterized protein YdhG (YjbR/CyaY superfamily)